MAQLTARSGKYVCFDVLLVGHSTGAQLKHTTTFTAQRFLQHSYINL